MSALRAPMAEFTMYSAHCVRDQVLLVYASFSNERQFVRCVTCGDAGVRLIVPETQTLG